jgi:hypothetical protein
MVGYIFAVKYALVLFSTYFYQPNYMATKSYSSLSAIKSVLMLLCTTWLLSSCTITRYQRVETAWSKKKDGEAPVYFTPDSLLKISYNLWEEGGLVKCTIENRSESNVFLVPYYTLDIVQQTDTLGIFDSLQCTVRDKDGKLYIRPEHVVEMLNEGIDLPVPPGGSVQMNTTYINAYTDFNYTTNNPAPDIPKFFDTNQSPFHFTKQIAYVKPNEQDITVVRHSFYVNFMYPYARISKASAIPEEKKKPNSFYLLTKTTGPLTYIAAGAAFVGVIILSALGEADQ